MFVAQLPVLPQQLFHGNVAAVAFDPDVLKQLRKEHKTVLVNITADWCVTCKTNEHNVFNSKDFSRLVNANNVVYMVGDWTNPDPQISAFLDQQKAVGVPLYQVYTDGKVETLPNVLTTSRLRQSIP